MRTCWRIQLQLLLVIVILQGVVCVPASANEETTLHTVEDLGYGRALYYFFQDDDLAAITRLMVNQVNTIKPKQPDQSDLLLADLTYRYGLYGESEQLFGRLLQTKTKAGLKNRVWMNLSRLHFESGFAERALDLITRIQTPFKGQLENERQYILTNIYLQNNQVESARKAAGQIRVDSIWRHYANFNLAAWLVRNGDSEAGILILERLGRINETDSERRSIIDQANLNAALEFLRLSNFDASRLHLEKIRLDSAQSQTALLALGNVNEQQGKLEEARIPWLKLAQRNRVDGATQEAILAIPASYLSGNNKKLATHYLQNALSLFDEQKAGLKRAIEKIKAGELADELLYNLAINEPSLKDNADSYSNNSLYLYQLLSRRDFRRDVKAYRDLHDIRERLNYWSINLPVFRLMLNERRLNFESKLPLLENNIKPADLAQLRERYLNYSNELNSIISTHNFRALANEDEREYLDMIKDAETSIQIIGDRKNTQFQSTQLAFLKGILEYKLESEFPVRLWRAKKQLTGFERALEITDRSSTALRSASNRFKFDFDTNASRISAQANHISKLSQRVERLIRRQESRLNGIAISELNDQAAHLQQLQVAAQFELTQLYDQLARVSQ